MNVNTAIDVQASTYFETMFDDCIMVHSDVLDVQELLEEFYKVQGITSNRGLKYGMLGEIAANFVSFLNEKGFVRLKTKAAYFCDE